MEKLSREKKRKKLRSRRKKKKPALEDSFVKDLKKMAEYKRLGRVFY